MSDIVHMDPGQLGGMSSSAGEVKAKSGDKPLIFLIILLLLALAAAAVLAVYSLLVQLYSPLNLLHPEVISSISWPFGLETRHVLLAGLILLAMLLYLATRMRVARNTSLQAIAGCPSCQKNELMRISRSRKDRLITLSGIRVARYQCRDCLWSGLRIYRRNYHPLELEPARYDGNASTTEQLEASPTPVPALNPAQPETASDDSTPVAAEISKPAAPTVTLTSPAHDSRDAAITAPTGTNPDSKQDQEPAWPVEIPAKNLAENDPDDARPAETIVVIAEPENITLPSKTSAANAQPVSDAVRADDGQLDKEPKPIVARMAKISTTFGVNLKAKPDSAARWVGLLGPETIVSLQRNLIQKDGNIWYYVKAGDQSGWVSGSYLEPLEE